VRYYEMSPDHNALIGAAGDPDGPFYATGFSGHGFQQGPVIGHTSRNWRSESISRST
jgi:glycine/D-amino acid oxidase-like deaminating enzyme